MAPVRIGAVEYLNARPLVYGLERDSRFDVRFDLPSRCAELLHAGQTDLGLIPSIELLRAPEGPGSYRIVPDLAVASRGRVASVAIFTTKEMRDVRSIALDTSSRTSVALTRVLCARVFGIEPSFEDQGPELAEMLARADAALIIGDRALFLEGGPFEIGAGPAARTVAIEKLDLGDVWLKATGLPFVYAFWAGRPGVVSSDEVRTLQDTRDRSLARVHDISELYFPGDAERQAVSDRYLRDNIKYHLGPDEQAGLERFYQYAAEEGVVRGSAPLSFFDGPS
jgi:chorismate dehydratase